MKAIMEKLIAWFFGGMVVVMLSVIGFFAKETFITIKQLEKEVSTIRVKLAEFEAKRISREEIERIIKIYHDNHPCINQRRNDD